MVQNRMVSALLALGRSAWRGLAFAHFKPLTKRLKSQCPGKFTRQNTYIEYFSESVTVSERVLENVVVIGVQNAGNHQFSKVSDPAYFLFKATIVEYV